MTIVYDPIKLPEPESVKTSEKGRFYLYDGEAYPSVTTVLGDMGKEGLKAWRERVGYEEAARVINLAARRGERVHKMMEQHIKGEKVLLQTPMDQFVYKSMAPIVNKFLGKVLALEAPLYSSFLKVGGRVDLAGEWEGSNAIVDFKTSLRPKPREWIDSYFMQEAAYAVMFEERTGIPISKLVILMYNDESKPQVFIDRRDNWIRKFMEERVKYKENHDV